MCELLVDLLDVTILGVEGHHREQVTIHFECRRGDVGCPECGVLARVKDRHLVSLVDLPMSGRPTRVVWHKRRFLCPEEACPKQSWSEVDDRIALISLSARRVSDISLFRRLPVLGGFK